MKKIDVSPDSIVKNNDETPGSLTPEKKKDHSVALESSDSKILTPDPDALDGESEDQK